MDLFDLLKKIEKKNKKLLEVFEDCQLLDEIISDLWDIILENYKIPEDNTVELIEKYGHSWEKATEDKDFYCRDYFYDLLDEFAGGEISKEEIIKKLELEANL